MITVAIGILINDQKQVLVEQRSAHISYAGYWAFPGGKVEIDESIADALHREMFEEIGITVESAEPLIHMQYQYPDKIVDLHTWRIIKYIGIPVGCENQLIRWVDKIELSQLEFLPPNKKIVEAVMELM
jgi:8-oxo-dGTP diphosphatase